jgi:UDP-glucose 4-epimerase
VSGVAYRTGHTKDITELIPENPAIVFHLGEYARTEKSFEDIELVWDLNKTGTFAVLEFCRRKKCKILYAGSSTKFADAGDGRDQSPYAWTKATNTELVQNYAEWFGVEYAITYFYNVYGPREMSGPYGTLIRIFTELHRNGQPFTITAPGTQTRNYTHVHDIVDGLILTAQHGKGDGYGIGADQMYSVLDVAGMFGGEVMMMPERKGNRQNGGVDNVQVKALGWKQNHQLPDWIAKVKEDIGTVAKAEQKVLVFSTTYIPDAGAAEWALYDVCKAMPNIQFDIITTKFSQASLPSECELPNVTLHRVGTGTPFDKFVLPLKGASIARTLKATNKYIFQWTLFASYGAFAALFSHTNTHVPLLITLADQKVSHVPWHTRLMLKYVLGKADQVYAMDTYEAQAAISVSERSTLVRSIGAGDAFANQVRFAYSDYLRKRIDT